MNCLVRRWRFALRLLALALIVAAVPLPVLAEDGKQVATRPQLQASVKPIVHAVVVTRPAAPKSSTQATKPADTSALESKSFFKKPAGLAVLAVLAGGVGYTIYSATKERIPPQGR